MVTEHLCFSIVAFSTPSISYKYDCVKCGREFTSRIAAEDHESECPGGPAQ